MIVPCIGCGAHVQDDGTIPLSMTENDEPADFVCIGCLDAMDKEIDKEKGGE